MEAESYASDDVAAYIEENFIPLSAHVKEHPAWFKRFDAIWTPTVLVMDSNGDERWRIEGYLPKDEFRAQLAMGHARVAMTEKRWGDAERELAAVVEQFPQSAITAEALYWRDVAKYSQSHDAAPLQSVAKELQQRFPDSVWTKKAQVWLSE